MPIRSTKDDHCRTGRRRRRPVRTTLLSVALLHQPLLEPGDLGLYEGFVLRPVVRLEMAARHHDQLLRFTRTIGAISSSVMCVSSDSIEMLLRQFGALRTRSKNASYHFCSGQTEGLPSGAATGISLPWPGTVHVSG